MANVNKDLGIQLTRGDVSENNLSSALTFELIGNVIILLQAS